MVRVDTAAQVLRPWLGTAFLTACDVCERACAALNAFSPAAGDMAALADRLNTLLFRQIRALTEGDMRVLLDDGRVIRVRVDDVDQMADELLYLALEQLPRSAEQYARLRGFAMTHESLSALRALYLRFTSFQTADELQLIARTVRGVHPPYRWRDWLPAEDNHG